MTPAILHPAPPKTFDLEADAADFAILAGGMDLAAIEATIPATVPDIPLSHSQIEGIGWDITLMPERRADIMKHYGLSGAQWVHLLTLPVFKAGEKHASQALKADPNLASRIVARGAMASAVLVAADLARSQMVEPKDRLAAIRLLSDIVQMGDTGVGAENRRAGAKGVGGGGGITINFGSVVGQALRSVIVDRDE
jgi:hypothetical protein